MDSIGSSGPNLDDNSPFTLDHAKNHIAYLNSAVSVISEQCREVQKSLAVMVVHRDQDRADHQATEQALQTLKDTSQE